MAIERTIDLQNVARIMGLATEQVLWGEIRSWAEEKRPGVQMIADKCGPQYMEAAYNWLGPREITARGYFGGQLTPLNAIAHTVCHELAHVVQCLNGWRLQNSVHNRDFYRILDRMHARGWADRVRDFIHHRTRSLSIDIPTRPFVDREELILRAKTGLRIGDPVTFSRRTGSHNGKIVCRKCTGDENSVTSSFNELRAPVRMEGSD